MKRRLTGILSFILAACMACVTSGCGKTAEEDAWLAEAALDKEETAEELYEKALKEDVLVVYTVSTRATQTKLREILTADFRIVM